MGMSKSMLHYGVDFAMKVARPYAEALASKLQLTLINDMITSPVVDIMYPMATRDLEPDSSQGSSTIDVEDSGSNASVDSATTLNATVLDDFNSFELDKAVTPSTLVEAIETSDDITTALSAASSISWTDSDEESDSSAPDGNAADKFAAGGPVKSLFANALTKAIEMIPHSIRKPLKSAFGIISKGIHFMLDGGNAMSLLLVAASFITICFAMIALAAVLNTFPLASGSHPRLF
ncbi:hypothetical protein HDU97_009260 [Phlyctochytrium planicorne]|nr:hypothetical protein HDU97_009260 [Phlyctochytrium planicorne]